MRTTATARNAATTIHRSPVSAGAGASTSPRRAASTTRAAPWMRLCVKCGGRSVTDQGYSLKIGVPRLDLPDFYASMSQMNRASLVMLHEGGIVPSELASRIATATQQLIERESQPSA